MKGVKTLFVLTVFLAHSATAERVKLNPVTRVVELLQGLSKKIETELGEERSLFLKFKCWCKDIIRAKEASNDEARARIDELNAFIGDVEAGTIEFTDERARLTKQLKNVEAELEALKAKRTQENKDFLAAKEEMDTAIAALTDAVAVLTDGCVKQENEKEQKEQPSFISTESDPMQAASLHQAVNLGERFLSKGDALFLARMLTGDVPEVDWKKLNRKATFKMRYKGRCFKIRDVLAELLETFQTNLKDATAKEKEAKENYEKIKAAKDGEKEATQEALVKMVEENGARGMHKQEATDEVNALTKQVEDDTKYIQMVQKSLDDKRAEWDTRKKLRTSEMDAIAQAIHVLYNDDARDNFKKSLKSQGYDFSQRGLQTRQSASSIASSVLKEAARKSRSSELLAIAELKDPFKVVLAQIDKLLVKLEGEEKEDLKVKEECESARMTETRTAVLAAREIDGFTETITTLNNDVDALCERIAAKEKEIAQTQEEQKTATKNRDEEQKAWVQSDAEDVEAAAAVVRASGILEKFYKDNELMLAQEDPLPYDRESLNVPAGEAPPPPPQTWEKAAYGGQTEAAKGILAILEMIHADIVKDRFDEKTANDKAKADYDAFMLASEEAIKAAKKLLGEMTGEKAAKLGEVVTNKGSRNTKKQELLTAMTNIKAEQPNCDYFAVNYRLRAENRQIEMDGLRKAKDILTGANFDALDPNRELKVGDAFLQRHI